MGQRKEDLGETEIEEIVSERCAQSLSCVWIFEILWTVASQSPLSLIPRQKSWQENWSRSPFAPLRDCPDPGIEPVFPMAPALAGRIFTTEPPRKPISKSIWAKISFGCCQTFWRPGFRGHALSVAVRAKGRVCDSEGWAPWDLFAGNQVEWKRPFFSDSIEVTLRFPRLQVWSQCDPNQNSPKYRLTFIRGKEKKQTFPCAIIASQFSKTVVVKWQET